MSQVLSQEQLINITRYINLYRERHHAKTLYYNKNIGIFSQSYASKMIRTNAFTHSGNPLYGENLAFFKGYQDDAYALIIKAIDTWYGEVRKYNFTNESPASDTGHFTQLCWNDSTAFGLGYAYNPTTTISVVTMNFNPPGNVTSKYKDNVFSP